MTLKLEAEREDVDPYESTTFAAKAGLEHRFSPDAHRQRPRSTASGPRSTTPSATTNICIVSLPSKLDYDGRDNKLDPTRGFRAILEAEPFADINAGTLALVSEGALAGYYGIRRRATGWCRRARLARHDRRRRHRGNPGDAALLPRRRRLDPRLRVSHRRPAGERRGGRRPLLLRDVARAPLPRDRHDRHRALHRCRRGLRGSDPGFLGGVQRRRRHRPPLLHAARAAPLRRRRAAQRATTAIPSRFTSDWGKLSDDAETIRQNASSRHRPHRSSLCSRSRSARRSRRTAARSPASSASSKARFRRPIERSRSTASRTSSPGIRRSRGSPSPTATALGLQLEGVEVVWTRSALLRTQARHRRAARRRRSRCCAGRFLRQARRAAGCLRPAARDRHRHHRAAASRRSPRRCIGVRGGSCRRPARRH